MPVFSLVRSLISREFGELVLPRLGRDIVLSLSLLQSRYPSIALRLEDRPITKKKITSGLNQQTQPTFDAGSGNRTRATMVGRECSHHCAIPANLDFVAPSVGSLGRKSSIQFTRLANDMEHSGMLNVQAIWVRPWKLCRRVSLLLFISAFE